MPSFGPLNKFAQDEKVEVEHVLEQCELCLGELSTFGFFLVLDFSGVKKNDLMVSSQGNYRLAL